MDNIQSIFDRAFKLHQEGQLVEAGFEYDKILSLNPLHFDALNLSSIVLASFGQNEAALERSNLAASINPNDPSVFNNQGIILDILGRSLDAISRYEMAISVNPNFAQAHYNAGNAYLSLRVRARILRKPYKDGTIPASA